MKVCIIGAGSSGIAAAKVLFEKGIDFICLEAGSGVGGNWRYGNDNNMSSAYASLHINTSKSMMAYSDFPMPKDYPQYPSHTQILAYFERYVDHFRLRPHMRFGCRVRHIAAADQGKFCVTTDEGEEVFDAVLVANGHHWDPAMPEFEGGFDGDAFHSHFYRTSSQLADKHALVVGIGNSAVDIACEGCRVAKSVTLSSRRSAYVFPKYVFGVPTDTLARPLVTRLPRSVQARIAKSLLWLSKGDQERYGVPKPDHDLTAAHPTISDELLHLVGHGRIQIKPNIARLIPDGAEFVDGTSDPFDVIVFATGYHVSFPFLSSEDMPSEGNRIQLYRRVVHPKVPGLYFIGLVQPLGAIMPIAERQSEWVAEIVRGSGSLPSEDEMNREITQYEKAIKHRYVRSPRHTIQVDFHPYMRELGREIVASRKRARKNRRHAPRYPSSAARPPTSPPSTDLK